MKLLVIITRMYVECGENGDEFTEWGVDENIHNYENSYVLFIQGCKYKKEIEGGNIVNAVNEINKKISEKIQNHKDIEEVGIIFHGHYDANIKSKFKTLKNWGEFEELFKKQSVINNIKISFIERYSHLDKEYENIKTMAQKVKENIQKVKDNG